MRIVYHGTIVKHNTCVQQEAFSHYSGGLSVTVTGKHLDSVTEPVMVVTAVTPFTDARYYQVNHNKSLNSTVHAKTPILNEHNNNKVVVPFKAHNTIKINRNLLLWNLMKNSIQNCIN